MGGSLEGVQGEIKTIRGSLKRLRKDVVYIGKRFENAHREVMDIVQNIMKVVTEKVSEGSVRREKVLKM